MVVEINVSNGIGEPVPTGTSGSVLFIDGNGNLGQDNTNFSRNNTTKLLTQNGAIAVTNALSSGTPGTSSQINTGDPNTKGLVVKGNIFEPTSKTPTQVTGLLGWWKADAITGLNDGDQISTWNDSSGNSNNATGGTNPKYRTNQINGLPAAQFDAAGGTQAYKTTTISNNQPYTVIAVVNNVGNSANNQAWSSDSQDVIGFVTSTNGYYSLYRGSSIISEASASTGWLITEAICNGSSSSVYVNATSRVTGNPGSFTLSNFRISSPSPSSWNGFIAEIMVFSGVLSTADRQSIEVYLASKYNISISSQTPQASDLMQFQNSNGTLLSGVDNNGRIYLVTSAGAPTGTPNNGATVVYDTTNNKLYVYNGGWKSVALA